METELELFHANFDTPWKDILDLHFQSFMEMCYPEVAKFIDWSKGYETLDKELNMITKDSETGRRIADKLIKIWRTDGEETWVLFHVEIQGQKEANFSERMYVYHYRLFDRYRKPIVSVAILADDKLGWRPSFYEYRLWGCHLKFDFVSIKLLDYELRREELKISKNPFATVVLAHLASLKTKRNEEGRFSSKLALTRSLYDKGLTKETIISLYSFIDWVMALPKSLELEYLKEIEQIEQEKNMKYITSAERIGIEKGMQEGIQKGIQEGVQKGVQEGEKAILLHLLQCKFGSIPSEYQERINEADSQRLLELAAIVISAKTLKDVFKN